MKLDILNALDSSGILKELGASSSKSVAASALAKLKIPNKKTEKYRYFDIEPLVSKDWKLCEVKEQNVEASGKKIVIEDGTLLNSGDIDGVSVELAEFSDIDAEHFDGLYFLSHLMAPKAIVIRCSKDSSFEIEHNYKSSDCLINYRVVILIDANTHCQISDSFKGEAKESFILSGYDIFVARDASLKFIKTHTLNSANYTPLFTSRYKVDSNANLKLSSFDFAFNNGLNIFRVELKENANIDASHLLYATDSAKCGVVSEIVHEGKSSTSSQIAKSILDKNARGIFDALIRVQNSAKWTKAHQNSKSVLLESGAYMASKPQLEIYIDDLEASHGSTTGQLDNKQLFYLQSRGIAKDDARKMLILAFAHEIIATVDDEYLANKIYADFETAYYGKYELDCMKTCDGCEESILGNE